MTTEETKTWFELFDQTHHKFKWFFDDYFSEKIWEELMYAREIEDQKTMFTIMNNVWFALPDGRFNIMENPKGWKEFLNLIEE